MHVELMLNEQSMITISGANEKGEAEELFIVLFRDKKTNSAFPMLIGMSDWIAIGVMLRNVLPSRPIVYDTWKNHLADWGIMVTKVVIIKLENDTFYAVIYSEQNGEVKTLDSRPSVAVALALRFSSPIFMEEKVFLQMLDNPETKQFLDFIEKNSPPPPKEPEESGDIGGRCI